MINNKIDLKGLWSINDEGLQTIEAIKSGTLPPRSQVQSQTIFTSTSTTRIVRIKGMLVKTKSLASDLRSFGLSSTSYEELIDSIATAPENAEVILHIDSPGGASQGLSKVSDILYEHKNKISMVCIENKALSAAWVLATAPGKRIIAEEYDTNVCCMGVRISQYISPYEQQMVDKDSPAKMGLETPEGRAATQEYLNEMAESLYKVIDRGGRSQTRELQGATITAKKALALNLIDDVGKIEIVESEP